MRRAARILIALLALLVTLGTVAVLAAVYLLHSPQGLEWAYRLSASRLPGALSVNQMSGTLTGPFTLEGVHYSDNGTDVAIRQLHMRWRPGDLFTGRLSIEDLQAQGVKVHTLPSKNGSGQPGALPNITLPLKANIAHARFDDVDFNATHLDRVEINDASFSRNRLEVQQLAVKAQSFEARAKGHISPQGDYPLDATVQWTVHSDKLGTLRGETHLGGDLKDLNIDQQLNAPLQGMIPGKINQAPGNPAWRAQGNLPQVNLLQQPQPAWPEVAVGGMLRAGGNLRQLGLQGRLHTGYQGLEADHQLKIAYQSEGDALQIEGLQSILRGSGAKLTLHGRIKNLRTAPQLELNGTWQDLHWPLHGKAQVRSDRGRFTLTGTLEQYKVHAEGVISGPQVPPGEWTLDGGGTAQALKVTRLELRTLGGTIAAHGEVSWRPRIEWNLSLQGNDLNPALRWPAWPGRLEFAADSRGHLQQGKPILQATLSALKGRLRSYPVEGSGRLKAEGEHYEIAKLRLNVGGNVVSAEGSVNQAWNLRWRLDAPALAKLADKGGGQLHGSGTVQGPRPHPRISADVTGTHLAYTQYHAAQARLDLSVDLSDRRASRIDLTASGISAGQRQVNSLHLQGQGRLRDHRLQLKAVAPNADVALKLEGVYANAAWQGKLTELAASTTLLGTWRLAAPVGLRASSTEAQADLACLEHDQSRACIDGHWSAAHGWQAQSRLRAIPLALFKPWLPGDVNLAGKLAADATLGSEPDGVITVTGQVRVEAALLPSGITIEQAGFNYHPTTIDLTLDRQGISLRLRSELAGGGHLNGQASLARAALPEPLGAGKGGLAHSLSGALSGEVNNLMLLPAFIPGVEHTQGRITVSLHLEGSPLDPRVSGSLHLEKGSAVIPALGISPDDIRLAINGDQQGRLHLEGSLHTKGGTLRITGDMRYDPKRGLILEARASGDKVQVMDTPEYHVVASPDLQLKLAGRRIDVTGEVVIPEANLRPRDLSGAVSPSDDVVIVSNDGAPAAAESRWQIYTQIRLRLGNFVKFNGFGLRGLITGELTLSDAPRQPTTARGELRINDGEYKAYGQKLTIDRGQLLFFGGDVANPGLDIRAVRQVDQVTAGIAVRGTLKAPKVQIFSEPPMSQGDALSFLLLGQPINQATATQGQQLYGAALSLGLAGSGLLANQIGQRFGIDELSVESGGSFGTGALVIRHYLSPKLYISYGIGLVERLNVFRIRYQISQLWSLDAESGAQSGADLVYTLERE